MPNTTFRCGHCGNLMAVSDQFLGQQVACPTCKQVVVAPAPQSAPMPALTPEPEPMPEPAPFQQPTPFPSLSLDSEHESIFSTPSSDDLFDEPAPMLAPALEYRHDPLLEPIQPAATETSLVDPVPVLTGADLAAPALEQTPTEPAWTPTSQEQALTEEPAPAEPDFPSMPRRKRDSGGNWLILFMIPLCSYAVLATALIFYLWHAIETVRNSVANPLEFMPDIHGDAPGAKKGASARGWKATDDLVVAPLPNNRKVKLGQTIVVGNLEVTPTRVERKNVRVYVLGYDTPQPCLNDSLVLHLRLKNLSKEYAFVPLEDSFDRTWTGNKYDKVPPLDAKPLTLLQVGGTNFFGGPADWRPRRVPQSLEKRLALRSWVEGRPDRPDQTRPDVQPLQPGATEDTFTCTNGQKPDIVPKALAYKGDLFWRVLLRQGPIAVKGRDQPVPSTTVVGVSFTAADVKQ